MDIAAKIMEVETRNAKLNEDLKVLVEQRAEIDRKIATLKEEAVRQQGEYRALKSLADSPDEKKSDDPKVN